MHWVPGYVRTELKKKTGIVVNEYGQKMTDSQLSINEQKTLEDGSSSDPNSFILNLKEPNSQQSKQSKKNFTPINSYKPSGNLVYDDDLLTKIEGKF